MMLVIQKEIVVVNWKLFFTVEKTLKNQFCCVLDVFSLRGMALWYNNVYIDYDEVYENDSNVYTLDFFCNDD